MNIWKHIKNKHSSESSKAFKFLTKYKLLSETNTQLKKSKLLVVFSLLILSITVMEEGIIINKVVNTFSVLRSNCLDVWFRVLIYNVIPILGFLGGLYIIKQRTVGLWLIGIWNSFLILPVVLSYRESPFNLSVEKMDSLNTISLFNFKLFFYQMNYHTLTEDFGNDYLAGLQYKLRLFPFTFGWGVNYIAIVFLLITFVLVFQNFSKFGKFKLTLFIFFVAISITIPFGVYYYCQERQYHKFAELNVRKMELHYPISSEINLYDNFHAQCSWFSQLWFKVDHDNLIKEISCYRENEIVVISKPNYKLKSGGIP